MLVQFWTYSCVNWIRTLPYVRAWAEKYRDKGLVVIGVHSPEFGFEHQLANVRWASGNFRVDYPVAMDNEFAIWRAFGNQYWPALYLIDGKGRVRHRHFGEGDYVQSERVIQDLLAEAGLVGSRRIWFRSPRRAPRRPPTGTISSRRRPTWAPRGARTGYRRTRGSGSMSGP